MKTTTQIKRSNRLEKKLYVGQYAVLGFEVSFEFADLDEQTFDNFFSELIDFVESRNLIIGGSSGEQTFIIYVSSYARYQSASEEDRCAFKAWLDERAFVTDVKVAELSDAYYGV